MSSGTAPLLETHDLAVGYPTGRKGTRVLAAGLNLRMNPGHLICLLGPNGAGKSSLLRTLSGLQKPLGGSVSILGKPISSLKPAALATRLSMVLTEKVQAGHLDVYTVIGLGRYPYTDWKGTLGEEDKKIVEEAMRLTGTEGFRHRLIHELSDGERQRVMIARALAQDTPLIILDEPTAYLDLPNRASLMRLLHDLSRQAGKAVLLSTHDLELALQTADDLWLLSGTGSMHTGAPEDLVLDGSFEAVFAGEGTFFDRDAGTFLVRPAAGRKIGLQGEGTPLVWTKRALQREGFEAVEGHARDGITILAEEEQLRWQYRSAAGSTSFSSIAELLQHIRERS